MNNFPISSNDAIKWIHSFKANGRRPDLNRLKHYLSFYGNPQHMIRAIHVVGTNGKGSTTTFIQSIFSESGYNVGTFTSPYILKFNERIAINGQPITDKMLLQLVHQIRENITELEILYGRLTEFELLCLMMFIYFAYYEPMDIVIIEAGIGGSFDSTNVFHPLVLVCPSISFDHENTLGHTLTEIAQHKIGALKPKVPLVFNSSEPSVKNVFYQEADKLSCPIYHLHHSFNITYHKDSFDLNTDTYHFKNLKIQMIGNHQMDNAALAIQTALLLKNDYSKLNEISITLGLKKAKLAGRFEYLGDNIILDGAHNIDSILKLKTNIDSRFKDYKVHILFSGLKRKPIEEMLHILKPYDLAVTTFNFFEAMPLKDYPKNFPKITDWKTWIDAIQNSDHIYIITGSFYFISQVREYIKKTKILED